MDNFAHPNTENALQVLEQNKEIYYTERVAIFFNGHDKGQHAGRTVLVDNRVLYQEKRFTTIGQDDLAEFVNRCGFPSIYDFFSYYENITKGADFFGIIRFKDGFRYSQK